MEIAEQHSSCGYGLTTAELRDQGFLVKQKIIERLCQNWHLFVLERVYRPRPNPIRKLLQVSGLRINLVAQIKEIRDLEVFYTNFTEIIYQRGQARTQIMPLVDHKSKLAVGQALGASADTQLALEARIDAKRALKKLGRPLAEVIVHHDQDGVYTGHCWLHEIVVRSKARISFSVNEAKENIHMESFTFKEVVTERLWCHNLVRKHSALGNKAAMEYLKEKWLLTR
jgi:hypothetical protein